MDKKKQSVKKGMACSSADHTGSKQTGEVVALSEERYRNILENMQDSYIEVDLTGNFTYINEALCQNLGYTRDELIGKNFSIIAPGNEGIREVFAAYNEVYKTGKPHKGFAFKVLRKDGTTGYGETSISLINDRQGRPVGFRSVGRDVTERKQMEEALLVSEERYRSILDQMYDVYYEVDLAGNFTFLNEATCNKLGYSQAEMIGKSYRIAVPKDDIDRLFAASKAVFKSGKPNKSFSHSILHKDGSLREAESFIDLRRNKQGDIIGFRTVSRDISERKKAEDTLRESEARMGEILEKSLDASYKRNLLSDTYDYLSPSFTKISGYTPDEMNALPLETVKNLMHPDDSAEVKRVISESLSNPDNKQYRLEYRFKHKQGHYRWIQDSYTVMWDVRGQPLALIGSVSDITERKQAEEALREERWRLQSIIEGTHVATWEWNVQTGETVFNETWAQIIGYTLDELSPISIKTWEALVHPDDLKQSDELLERHFSGELSHYDCDCRMKHKDGHWVWVHDRGRIVTRTSDGKPLIMFGTHSDITERTRAKEALRESAEFFSSAFSINPDPTAITVPETGQFIDVNPAYEKWSGFSREELLRKTSRELNLWVNPADRDTFLKRLRDHKAVDDMEITFRVSSGELRDTWFTARTAFIGGMEHLLTRAHDVTERNRMLEALHDSEEKYRLVVENAREAIVIAENGVIKFGNRQASALTGYSQEEYLSRPLIAFIHPDDRHMVAKRYFQQINNMEVTDIFAFRLIGKSRDIKWVEVSLAPIIWEGRPASLNFMHDVTDRKRLEEERQRVARLESVGLLAGGIAHDFNNILTSILGNISLAGMEAAPGSELQNSLDQAEKASLRAKDLTRQLLTFSKGGAPVLKLASLTELIRDTAGFALRGSNVKCRFSIPADLWHAEIDAGQISQVIHNLVINAQQAMPTGGTIEIIAENMTPGGTQSIDKGLPLKAGAYIRISVVDHGTGIPSDHLEKIFDPFFSTKQKGSGLGLATSFSIAHQHGGHISVESAPGAGSTFHLYLPASLETVNREPEQDRIGSIKPAGSARILVMDDEQGLRDIAGRLLQHIGYQDVVFASDGAEAIKLYKASMKSGRPFTVAILDLTIAGGMGGKEAIKKLLKVDPGVKAIVSSGYADDPVISKYRHFGFSGMVAKPYTIEELRKALQDVIE